MKVNIFTQARISSTRLPSKVLLNIGNESVLFTHLKRLKKSKIASQIIVATTNEVGSNKIIEIAKRAGCSYSQGSTDDVLDRFYQASLQNPSDLIVRVTSDCPLNDAELIDQMLNEFISVGNLDYMSNANPPTFADGLDVEIFTSDALKKAWQEAKLSSEREHVTPYIWKQPNIFRANNFVNSTDESAFRLTVDTQEDLQLINELVNSIGADCPWKKYVEFLKSNPEIVAMNSHYARNEGYLKSLKKD